MRQGENNEEKEVFIGGRKGRTTRSEREKNIL